MTNVGSALFFDGTALFEGTAIIETTITYTTLEIVDPEFIFCPGSAYTPAQLDGFATMILRAHIKSGASLKGPAPILMEEHLKTRHRREIYNKTGVPDPSIQQGNYWRTHPEGRNVNTEDARKKSGASFYR